MLKLKTLALSVLALCAFAASAQSPTDGKVIGNAYANHYFHFAYAWPAILSPYNPPAAAATRNDPNQYQFPLFTARQGSQPYGVMVVAEKLNAPVPHSAGVKTAAEFIDRLANGLRPGPMLSNITKSEKKGTHGVSFSELDYVMAGQPSATIATQIGDYVIVFKCNAKTDADLAQIRKSVLDLRLTK